MKILIITIALFITTLTFGQIKDTSNKEQPKLVTEYYGSTASFNNDGTVSLYLRDNGFTATYVYYGYTLTEAELNDIYNELVKRAALDKWEANTFEFTTLEGLTIEFSFFKQMGFKGFKMSVATKLESRTIGSPSGIRTQYTNISIKGMKKFFNK
jgi:hypothetical protein